MTNLRQDVKIPICQGRCLFHKNFPLLSKCQIGYHYPYPCSVQQKQISSPTPQVRVPHLHLHLGSSSYIYPFLHLHEIQAAKTINNYTKGIKSQHSMAAWKPHSQQRSRALISLQRTSWIKTSMKCCPHASLPDILYPPFEILFTNFINFYRFPSPTTEFQQRCAFSLISWAKLDL